MGASRDRVFLDYYFNLSWEYHDLGIWESPRRWGDNSLGQLTPDLGQANAWQNNCLDLQTILWLDQQAGRPLSRRRSTEGAVSLQIWKVMIRTGRTLEPGAKPFTMIFVQVTTPFAWSRPITTTSGMRPAQRWPSELSPPGAKPTGSWSFALARVSS